MDICYLYTPALKVDSLVASRAEIRADMVVVDLEDSTHLQMKGEARRKVADFDFRPLAARGFKLGLRINTLACYDGLRDLELLSALQAKGNFLFEHVFIPKVGHANEVKLYRSLLGSLPRMPKLYVFIETVEAVDNAEAIASVSDALCFGQADLVAEMYAPNETFVNFARARLCIAAAKYDLLAIDTNSFDIEDMAAFEEECKLARGYGFTGKAAIHPRQVPVVNRTFAVTPEMVARYESSIGAYMGSNNGFVIKDGEVIAPPFIAKARRMLNLYRK
jgi:citrate lyase beta subunit